MKGLYFNLFGSPEVLQYGEIENPQIKANEVLVKTRYIGLNFADIYRRKGNYHIEPHNPYINGYEAVGEIVEIGTAVSNCALGEVVLFVDVPFANAELVAVPQDNIIKIPDGMDIKLAAGIGLQGLTADFLAHDLGRNKAGDNIFIYGISGGVGQILSQMLIADGINVYGVTSSEGKKNIALEQGAKKVFLKSDQWFADYKNTFNTVYDGVGVTLQQSVDLIENRGKVVFFGMAGGNPPQINFIDLLAQSKSILTGDLWDYLTDYAARAQRSKRLFSYFESGKIRVTEPAVFKLCDGKAAHELLESGKNIGKILLEP